MKVGIVSDSHGDARRLEAALDMLVAHGARALVHCGDVGSTPCIELLGEAGLDAIAVAGNMDHHPGLLQAAAQRCGVGFAWEVAQLSLGPAKCLAATHGHDGKLVQELISGGQFAYVCHGHTHRVRDERIGPVRVLNPGALHRPRDRRHPTVCLLDSDADATEFFDVVPV